MDGVINLDKPAGISSAAAVGRVKRLLPRKIKIGHAGTLDPFATGVLLILVGKATKLSQSLMDQPKRYEATAKFVHHRNRRSGIAGSSNSKCSCAGPAGNRACPRNDDWHGDAASARV